MHNAIDSNAGCPDVVVAGTNKSKLVHSMYRRLPHGPHGMTKNEVLNNQLHRIHGAVVEAISRWGYEGTTVARIVQLSGVSRRVFYERFSNKEDCFIRTAGVVGFQILSTVRERRRATEDASRDSGREALEIFLDEMQRKPKAARLLLVEAPQRGPAAAQVAFNTIGALERLILEGVAGVRLEEVPGPVRYGVSGALHWMLEQPLRGEEASRLTLLADVMHSWVMLLNSQLLGMLKPRRSPPQSALVKDAIDDVRGRLLNGVLRLAITTRSGGLVGLQIADCAGVSLDEFNQHFSDPERCYGVAFQEIAVPLLELTCARLPDSRTWVYHVHQVSSQLLSHLAENPLHAEAIVTPACAFGESVERWGRDLAGEIAERLTADAPDIPNRQTTVYGIAGAIWGLIYQLVRQGKPGLLAALSDYFSYLVLAPFIGPQSAIKVIARMSD
jgi:AcrR family transcriptional regulator